MSITIQNTLGVQAVHPIPLEILEGQIDAVLSDIGADAIKIGMLHSVEVVNWTPVLREGMHVDPLNIMARCVIDGTGHDSEMCRTVARKNGIRLATDTGDVIGERSLDVVSGKKVADLIIVALR